MVVLAKIAARTGMEGGARRQARETSWVGNMHQNWITANTRVSPRFWQLPRQRCLPHCPVLPVPAAAPAPGRCSYPAFSHIALLFSIFFKLYLIPHNIFFLQIVFPVTGKMRGEFWHLGASWHRAAGGTCHHTLHIAALLPCGTSVPPELCNWVSIESPT